MSFGNNVQSMNGYDRTNSVPKTMCGETVERNMKKKVLASILASAMLCTAFAGCGSTSDTTTTGTTAAPAGGDTTTAAETDAAVSTDPVELVVWESTLGPDKWIQQAGAKFTEQYPNITIKYVNVESGDSASQIALDGPAGVGPDLFAAPHDKLGELVTGGHVLPTDDAETVAGEVLASCASALTYNGTMYGYPTSAETYALYYNKDLISEEDVPKTWEDLISWCETFNAANSDKYGFIMDVSSIYYSILFTTANGNRLFGESGTDTSSSYLATEDSITGMKLFQSLRNVLPIASADLGTDFADAAFSSGTAAMHISGPWNISSFTDAGINFGVTTLPSLPGTSTPAASFSGTRGLFVSAYTDHAAEADLFAKFLLTDEMQSLRYEITGALPSTNIAVDSEYAQGFISQLEYAFPMPSVPQMTAIWDVGTSASCNIWDGADVATELQNLDTAVVNYAAE